MENITNEQIWTKKGKSKCYRLDLGQKNKRLKIISVKSTIFFWNISIFIIYLLKFWKYKPNFLTYNN